MLWAEFAKLRRRRAPWLLLLASTVMPVFTYLYYFTHPGCGYTFLSIYRQGMFSLGAMVLLPICLGVLAALLVDGERQTRVLWQLWLAPVSAGGYLLAKLAMLFAFSAAYFACAAAFSLGPVMFIPALRPGPGELAAVMLMAARFCLLETLAALPMLGLAICQKNALVPCGGSVLYGIFGFILASKAPFALPSACAALWGVQGVPGVRFPVPFSLRAAFACFGVWGAAAVVTALHSLREVG